MSLVALLGVVILFFYVLDQSGKIKRLQDQINELVEGKTTRKSGDLLQEPSFQSITSTDLLPPPLPPQSSIQTLASPDATETFLLWLKTDWLLKLGALLILIAFGWLVTYAFLNNWIGPVGRIFSGIVAGSLILLLGWWRMKTYPKQGGVFLVLGSTTILLSMYAARTLYDFFTPGSALAIMCVSTAFVALASVVYKRKPLALASLVLAYVAPLLVHSPNADYVALFAYLFVITIGALWIVFLTRWGELALTALVFVALYSMPHFILWGRDPNADVLLLFAYAFTTAFFLTNAWNFKKGDEGTVLADAVTAAGNGLFLLAWIKTATPEWQSLILSVWAIVFAVGAFIIWKITARRESFFAYAGVGVALLAAATATELSGAALTIALTVECAVISIVVYLSMRNYRIAINSSYLFFVPIFLSLPSFISSDWHNAVFGRDFFVLAALGVTLLYLGYFFWKLSAKESVPDYTYAAHLTAGSYYIYALIWLSLHAGSNVSYAATMTALLIYTLVGLFFYVYGNWIQKKGLIIYGGLLLGLVVARLLLVEVWSMELTWRIVTFFLVGTLLVGTAFLGKKKNSQ